MPKFKYDFDKFKEVAWRGNGRTQYLYLGYVGITCFQRKDTDEYSFSIGDYEHNKTYKTMEKAKTAAIEFARLLVGGSYHALNQEIKFDDSFFHSKYHKSEEELV